MNNGFEKGRDPRIPVDWPVVLMTPKGAIEGKTVNISVSDLTLLIFSEMPEIGDELKIILEPSKGHEIPVTCKKMWSGSLILDESVYIGIGARFTKISPSDREIIASLVAEYQPF